MEGGRTNMSRRKALWMLLEVITYWPKESDVRDENVFDQITLTHIGDNNP